MRSALARLLLAGGLFVATAMAHDPTTDPVGMPSGGSLRSVVLATVVTPVASEATATATTGAVLLSAGPGHGYVFVPSSREIHRFAPAGGDGASPSLLLRDRQPGLLGFTDFAILATGGVAIADNSRRAVYLFRGYRFHRAIGRIGERDLFSCIRHLFANEAGTRLGVYDSGRDRTFLFDVDGRLLNEVTGRCEPAFFGRELLRLQTNDRELTVEAFDPGARSTRTVLVHRPQPDRLILDAWVAGTCGERLVVVVYEGVGDEDHLDLAKVLIYDAGALRQETIQPRLDFATELTRPYALLANASETWLASPREDSDAITIEGWELGRR